MDEDNYKPLLMGYVDHELTETEASRFEAHLKECIECREELGEFQRLKEVTHSMRLAMPDDRYWEDYWSHVYNRLERRAGWILTSIGIILLLSYGLYKGIEELLFHSGIPRIIQIGVLALIVGLCTLLVSVLRERLFLAKSDKYERIKR